MTKPRIVLLSLGPFTTSLLIQRPLDPKKKERGWSTQIIISLALLSISRFSKKKKKKLFFAPKEEAPHQTAPTETSEPDLGSKR